jgi:membrane-associated protease RseP (regulator of RpoE activity)
VGLPSWPGGPRDSPPSGAREQDPIDPWLRSALPLQPPRSAWQRWGRNLLLFVLTAASVFLVGGLRAVEVPGQGTLVGIDAWSGARLAIALLAILLAHEMGHYLTGRHYGVDVTLPFFIPFPVPGMSLVGTLGAFIRIRSPIPNRRALFDIGVAGPLAGFAVCLPVLWLGIREATVQPLAQEAEGLFLGEPLLFGWLTQLIHGSVAADQTLVMGPLGLAAWFGLLVTALNLMPIGQLDGGHVTYSLLRDRAHAISRIASWVCIALIYFGPSWILWAILMRVLGRRHPPTLDNEVPVGPARVLVGVLSLVVFVVCFVPDPIVVSWREVLEGTPFERLLP